MRITYNQRLLVALLNIDKYNNIVNNTKEYQLIKRKDKTRRKSLSKILIEGSNDLSTVMNQEQFTHVFKLIKSTHRFNR
jgi:hypothetical protein